MTAIQTELSLTTHPEPDIGANQQKDIIRWMNEHGSITPFQALRELGIMRLASRVGELRKRGYQIDTQYEEFTTRYNRKSRYARYVFTR